jgi:hypothetical protein
VETKNEVNPLEDYEVEIPDGVNLSGLAGPGSSVFDGYERAVRRKLSEYPAPLAPVVGGPVARPAHVAQSQCVHHPEADHFPSVDVHCPLSSAFGMRQAFMHSLK